MNSSNKIKKYLSEVCDQIRWKKSHEIISEEMEDHIIDQKNAFISQGLDKETAIDKAILEMGDPVDVGTKLDSVYRPKPEWGIIILTGLLLVFGIIVRNFITQNNEIPQSLTREIGLSIIGIGVMIIAYFLDFTIIGKYPRTIYLGLILGVIGSMVIYPFNLRVMGKYVYTKYIILLFPTIFAAIIYNMRNKGYRGIIYCVIYFLIPAILCLIIPSFSSLAIYSIICMILLTLAILKGLFNIKKLNALALIYIPTLILGLSAILPIKRYQLDRIKYAINPSLDPYGGGYVVITIRDIIKNAKIIGSNLSSSNIKDVLPSINIDFILTNLIYTYGWLAFIVLMVLVLLFIVKSIKASLNQKGVLGSLVSMSIVITFTIQVIFYLINNLGLIYIDPMVFPLISYGVIGLIVNMFLIGFMLSVYKSKALSRNEEKTINSFRKNKLLYFLEDKN